MAFPRVPMRAPARPRVRVDVFAVGRHAYVACAGAARVTLTDDGDQPLARLTDGSEVTIVAWRPGWAGTTRYCVRVTDSGVEGWLPVGDLRGTKTPTASPTVVRVLESKTSEHRFGQRPS